MLSSCYNDDDLKNSISGLEDRMDKLEASLQSVQTDISTLKTLTLSLIHIQMCIRDSYLVCSNKNGFDPDNDIEWEFSWRLHYEYDSEAQKTYLSIVPGEEDVYKRQVMTYIIIYIWIFTVSGMGEGEGNISGFVP